MFGSLRNKLGQAIEWRVVREVDREREVINSLGETLAETAIALEERIAVLEKLVEELTLEARKRHFS